FDEQFLMSVASLGAVAIGEFPEAVAVMLFYQIGEYFQDYALGKSRGSITALMAIRPDKATVLRGGMEAAVAPEDVKPGETVVVRPGERIPVDGVLVKGKTFLDNSALTGESVPLEVFEGNDVFSGAINTHAAIEIRAVRPAADSAAARILALVEESAAKKARTERFIRRFARIYTPIVCAAALLIAVVPPLVLGGWNEWIYRALIFLVVSCPCALVISVPLTFFGGIGAASRQGILVKGSSSIEALAKTRTAVFDKTGTLTKGIFVVTDVHCAHPDTLPEDELVAIAAHAELYSNHPVSKSLRQAHHADCCSSVLIQNAEEVSGRGIRVELDGKTVLAGNERLMIESAVNGYVRCEKEDAGTVVHVAVGGEYAGHIVISDETKSDAADAVRRLRRLGVRN
ncbi:MAG: cadmium-translocating P-type ATPase, partial [Treponemataceae bacterium]|nr:cadmium-translocating P-type ATPase [Treponemataceae bacterium]